jgi:hypothetical protein
MNTIYVNDIWELSNTYYIVIPTNIGWKSNGKNVMGAGLAKEATIRFPVLAEWYGTLCRHFRESTPVSFLQPLILFPTKDLNRNSPWLSWKNKSTLGRIEKSAKELNLWIRSLGDGGLERRVAMPPVGCGNGKLNFNDVRPILEKHLNDLPVDLVFRY